MRFPKYFCPPSLLNWRTVHRHILADQLTLFQPGVGGRLSPQHYNPPPPPDFQNFLLPCRMVLAEVAKVCTWCSKRAEMGSQGQRNKGAGGQGGRRGVKKQSPYFGRIWSKTFYIKWHSITVCPPPTPSRFSYLPPSLGHEFMWQSCEMQLRHLTPNYNPFTMLPTVLFGSIISILYLVKPTNFIQLFTEEDERKLKSLKKCQKCLFLVSKMF